VAPVVVSAPRKRSTAATLVNVLLGVAVVVAVGGVAFAAGRATAPAQTTAGRFGNGGGFAGNGLGPTASGAPGRSAFGGAFGAGGGGVSLQGTVTAVAADSITLQLASGQTLTIPIDSSTTYHSQAPATATDVTAGRTVIVQLSGGRFVGGGNGGTGNGNGNGAGGQGRGLGAASSVTVVPAS
jgi:hypothetical protein